MSKRKDVNIEVPLTDIAIAPLSPQLRVSREFEKISRKHLTYMWLTTICINILTSFGIIPFSSYFKNILNSLGITMPNIIAFVVIGLISVLIGTLLSLIPFNIGRRAIKRYVETEITS